MKTKLILLAVALCAVAAAVTGTRVEWAFHGQPILQHRADGETLELGLRDDGVVIWRRITSATNSPGEPALWLPIIEWPTSWSIKTNQIFWMPDASKP